MVRSPCFGVPVADSVWRWTGNSGKPIYQSPIATSGKTQKQLANDHWLMLALSYLYHYSGKESYLKHSLNLAR